VVDIEELPCETVVQYKDQGEYAGFRPSLLLAKYNRFLKMKAQLYRKKNSSYNV
jgi:hypothetical protein